MPNTPFKNQLTLGDLSRTGLVVLVLGGFVLYILFQARYVITGPQINLASSPATHQNTRVIELAGSTKNITFIWLNGRQIFTNEKGEFREDLVLENGYTIATLRAVDRYGREVELVKPFVYTPASLIKENS